MVKDHSDSEKGNPLPPHRLLLSINSKGSFICTIPDRITHTTAFVTPVVEHWLEREIATWSKMDWKDHYVNVINTKNDNHTTSDNNVGHSDVRYKNQTSTSWTINRAQKTTLCQSRGCQCRTIRAHFNLRQRCALSVSVLYGVCKPLFHEPRVDWPLSIN